MKEQSYNIAPSVGSIMAYRRYADGHMELLKAKPNVIAFRAADILAKILGGDAAYIPSKIGFIYAGASQSFTNPGTVRLQEWSDIATAIGTAGGNMILCPLASPTFMVLGDSTQYANNMVELSAMSDKSAPMVFSGGSYAADAPASGSKYFQVVLLAVTYAAGSTTPVYTPYAIAQLTDTNDGLAIEDNTDIVIYWSMSFN